MSRINDAEKLGKLDMRMSNSKVRITVHEDNQGMIALAKEYRIRPRTKHINAKCWHFTKLMERNKDIMKIQWVPSHEQLADILTKPLQADLQHKFTRLICGWTHPLSSDKHVPVKRECDNIESQLSHSNRTSKHQVKTTQDSKLTNQDPNELTST